MHSVFVVPGIMGSELFLPDTGEGSEMIWPPTPLETQFGYKRTRKLARPEARTGNIIDKVLCFDFYRPLLSQIEELGFTPTGAEKRRRDFPYDWRRDLFDVAADLATAIGEAVSAGATRISLVAHSMGGLVCRLLLEQPASRAQPWFGAIDQLIAIATPHLGAPLALGRVLGRDSALGISGADFAWLSNLDAYPSAYQLLPAPGEAACWDQSEGAALAPIDIYDTKGISQLGLNPMLIARVKALHDVLGAGNQPPRVRYFYFAATGHRTVTRINVFKTQEGLIDINRTVLTLTENGGDGTVPLFSALPRPGQRMIATNEHAGAFKGVPFHTAFVRLLGGNAGDALELALAANLALSVESPVVTSAQTIEILLFVDAPEEMPAAITELAGDLVLEIVRDGDELVRREVRRVPLHYAGPAIDRLRVYLKPVELPGHYKIRLEAPPYAASATFGVCLKPPLFVRTDSAGITSTQNSA